jgi:hypothetical protein
VVRGATGPRGFDGSLLDWRIAYDWDRISDDDFLWASEELMLTRVGSIRVCHWALQLRRWKVPLDTPSWPFVGSIRLARAGGRPP